MVVGDKLSACLMLVPDDCLSEPEIKALNWVDGSWWDVETVPAGVKCHFEEGSTLVVAKVHTHTTVSMTFLKYVTRMSSRSAYACRHNYA